MNLPQLASHAATHGRSTILANGDIHMCVSVLGAQLDRELRRWMRVQSVNARVKVTVVAERTRRAVHVTSSGCQTVFEYL